MSRLPIIQIHRHGRWLPAATLEPLADDRARVDYLPDYIFSDDAWPIALGLPVGFAPPRTTADELRAPPFLYDLVPQGKGRHLLLQLLQRGDQDNLVLPLVLAGAFNPIGALRIDTALEFYEDHVRHNPALPGSEAGFTFADLANRREGVFEHLSTYAMLASGTTGVQGVAPKYLLTEDVDGRLHADLALPDEAARAHWLVKGPRNASDADRRVLRNEAAYLRVAAACGLRTHAAGDAVHANDLLRVRRFDRIVTPQGVLRLPQESLASLAGLQGFGVPCRLNTLLQALRRHASDPLAETIEFLRRDVLNLALRNTDNHARNHAVQRLPDGRVQLTPLFDFAPMFLDPELIPRAVHWANADDVRLHEWAAILPQLNLPDTEAHAAARALADFADTIGALPDTMRDLGVDAEVIDACRGAIAAQAAQLREGAV
jgi:serine/threonine-protein kinase HipA